MLLLPNFEPIAVMIVMRMTRKARGMDLVSFSTAIITLGRVGLLSKSKKEKVAGLDAVVSLNLMLACRMACT